MIKSQEELDAMQRASDLTDQVFRNILPQLKAGVTEFEIAHEIDYQFVTLGAEYTSFETGVFFIAEAMDGGGQDDPNRHAEAPARRLDHVRLRRAGRRLRLGLRAFRPSREPSAEYQRVHDTVIRSQADAMATMVAGRCTARRGQPHRAQGDRRRGV
jgi:hypothetical protein